MDLLNTALWDGAVNLLAQGLLNLTGWQIVLVTLVLTHVTIVSVTVFLHRHQAHRALDLHPLPSHFFRLWLWLTTGMLTRDWAAIHRKHHAKCEQPGDPHSPVIYGLRKVLLEGAELYRAEAQNPETLARYGHGTPDDWVERHVYSRYPMLGVSLMLVADLLLFGAAGAAVWAVQMAWIPVHAAGIINGLGHAWGYRNFEAQDASTNISPWGIWIGGEELHNNHHTYPTSAKLSVKPYEFDIGWGYIRALELLGLASVKKTPPRLAYGDIQPVADEKTLEALIAHRYELMAGYARQMRALLAQEMQRLQAQARQARQGLAAPAAASAPGVLPDGGALKAARRWLHRDAEKIPAAVRAQLQKVRAAAPSLDQMVTMREELRQMWLAQSRSREQLAADLQAWCQRAEASGVAALREFSLKLRMARA